MKKEEKKLDSPEKNDPDCPEKKLRQLMKIFFKL